MTPCGTDSITSFSSFRDTIHYDNSALYANDSVSMTTDTTLDRCTSSESSMRSIMEDDAEQSTDIVRLLHLKQRRIEAILQLRQREEEQMHKANEYKKQYFRLQDYYRQAELAIHALSQNEQNVE